jgi:hypothetical protein
MPSKVSPPQPPTSPSTGEPADADGAAGGFRCGRIVALRDDRRVMVEFDGGPGPTLARLAVPADGARLQRALTGRELALLAFEDGEIDRPLVIALLGRRDGGVAAPARARREVVEADVDGRRVLIAAEDEIVFQCGKASVTLRRNGRVVIRGTHVETDSEGTNRIKGGQVRIN